MRHDRPRAVEVEFDGEGMPAKDKKNHVLLEPKEG